MAEVTLEKFSADFLTERLRASGALPRGRVVAVHAGERRTTLVSMIAPLRVEYSSDAPAESPTRLLLKATRGGLDPGLQSVGQREVGFYRHAAGERLITPGRLYATYTIVHGDAHVWNLLYPDDGIAATDIRLIDWDNWRIGRAATDLAYMMAVHWYPERRARLEAPLLERYHAGLCARGITDYSLERLWEDYRLAVIGHLAIPVWQQTLGLPPAIWWSHLHRIIAAFEDLNCATLLA